MIEQFKRGLIRIILTDCIAKEELDSIKCLKEAKKRSAKKNQNTDKSKNNEDQSTGKFNEFYFNVILDSNDCNSDGHQ